MTGIHYESAQDIKSAIEKIALVLEMNHLNLNRIFCIRSHGSASRGIIARCHALPKIMQQCLEVEPAYIIEVISETFDRQSEDERVKTIIHELLHIPNCFGGGFRHHDVVTRSRIEKLYARFRQLSRPQ
jgi:predicted metallopeptidase